MHLTQQAQIWCSGTIHTNTYVYLYILSPGGLASLAPPSLARLSTHNSIVCCCCNFFSLLYVDSNRGTSFFCQPSILFYCLLINCCAVCVFFSLPKPLNIPCIVNNNSIRCLAFAGTRSRACNWEQCRATKCIQLVNGELRNQYTGNCYIIVSCFCFVFTVFFLSIFSILSRSVALVVLSLVHSFETVCKAAIRRIWFVLFQQFAA